MGLSVVIPIAEGDEAWKVCLPDLRSLSADDEVIISSSANLKDEFFKLAAEFDLQCTCHWAPSQLGRAKQLNTGARWAKNDFLWFLHCDSRLHGDSRLLGDVINLLKEAIAVDPRAIHFFDLKFLADGPPFMRANTYGVWFRSRILRLPFGDQGFCLHRETLRYLGGFCEKASYGEDHLLIWRAHQEGVKLRAVGASLYTSARRYRSFGWVKTTMRHLFLTFKQAIPEFFRLLRSRMRGVS